MPRLLKTGLAIAVAAALITGTAVAQEEVQPQSAEAVSYGVLLEDGDAEIGGGCQPSCDSCCQPSCDSCCQPTCDSCSSSGCSLDCCEEDPLRLLPHGLGAGFDVRGWVEAGVTFNDNNPASNFNGVTLFNDRQDEVQVNQIYLIFERAVETGQCAGFDVGGRVDLLYGSDARFVEVDGLMGGNNDEPFYGLAIPQAYLEVGYNNLSVKMGHFYTIVGYEGVMADGNFFYSRSQVAMYGEPFTHTGLLASLALGKRLTVLGGFDRGWDRFDPNPDGDHLGYFGGLQWEHEHWGTSFAATFTSGRETANPFISGLKGDQTLCSFVVQQRLTKRLDYVLQSDIGRQQFGSPFTGLSAEWYGINQYLFYKLNCNWTLGVRGEWFRDDDGARVGGIGSRDNGSPIGAFGFSGDFYNLSLGANYKPNGNLTVRPELRFDWYSGASGFGPRPYDDGADDEQITGAIDFIVAF